MPPKKYNSEYEASQIILTPTKFIENNINIYVFK